MWLTGAFRGLQLEVNLCRLLLKEVGREEGFELGLIAGAEAPSVCSSYQVCSS